MLHGLQREAMAAVDKLKSHKAEGSDGISAELVKDNTEMNHGTMEHFQRPGVKAKSNFSSKRLSEGSRIHSGLA
jgi:hypothetical protein